MANFVTCQGFWKNEEFAEGDCFIHRYIQIMGGSIGQIENGITSLNITTLRIDTISP